MCHFELIPFGGVQLKNDSKNIADNLSYIHIKAVNYSFLIWYKYFYYPL